MIKSKKGSIYVEASLVMPVTCLISISLIGLAMTFFSDIRHQVDYHKEELEKWSQGKEASYIRSIDRLEKDFDESVG